MFSGEIAAAKIEEGGEGMVIKANGGDGGRANRSCESPLQAFVKCIEEFRMGRFYGGWRSVADGLHGLLERVKHFEQFSNIGSLPSTNMFSKIPMSGHESQ
ncbi:antibiotic biosynthesis monooxygenase [Babesia caballi]|uniref:Antibiotic biosynthesis monooxygenase n=1 Tax=Babesia caballi TaxID=5871 RepID=A0AAV4LRW5_BABCB|nr:antibiotic biosynthesis monooxygenase [Babesia caballi]